jgi:hypothetical protein
VTANPDKPWRWGGFSENPNITWDIVTANPDKPWVWPALASNPNITWDIVVDNPDKDWGWGWYKLSGNPNITWDIIIDNPDKPWDWDGLSCNEMGKHTFILKKRTRQAILSCKENSDKHGVPDFVFDNLVSFF